MLLAAGSLAAGAADSPGQAAYRNKGYAAAHGLLLSEAKAGNVESERHPGLLYYFGRGVEKNGAAAHRWFGAAADKGSAKAQWNVGQDYEDGEVAPRSGAGGAVVPACCRAGRRRRARLAWPLVCRRRRRCR